MTSAAGALPGPSIASVISVCRSIRRSPPSIRLTTTRSAARRSRALVVAGFATSVQDAFARLIGHGAPGYIRREGLGPDGAIRAIVAAGGVAVLAHFREASTRLDLLRELVELGLAGLEVHYGSWDRVTIEAVAQVATSLGLTPTGGSDYHGDTGTYAVAHAGLWVPPEVSEGLLERIESGLERPSVGGRVGLARSSRRLGRRLRVP